MAAKSEFQPSLDCGHNSAVVEEPEYENVSLPSTQSAISAGAGTGRNQSGKKPKPSPKPNFVAMRIAEWSSQQKLGSNGSTSKPPPTKAGQRGPPGSTPPRPAAPVAKPMKTGFTENGDSQFGINTSSSDPHLYDMAVRVQLDVLQQISENVPRKYSATTDAPDSEAATRPIYATPRKRSVVQQEPIYDEAIAVVSPDDDEPVYDEAIIVHSDRLPTTGHTTLGESEPLYADPDDFTAEHLQTASTAQYSNEDLYDEAHPVNRMAIPDSEIYSNATQVYVGQ